jgi:hypothetical protein
MLATAASLLALKVSAAEILDASTVETMRVVSTHFSDTYYTAQTFTAGFTGTLTRVDIGVFRWSGMSVNARFEIRRTLDGLPNDDAVGLLATHVIPYNQLPIRRTADPPPLLSIDLSDVGVSVTAGDMLAIICKHDPEFANSEIPEVWLTRNSQYSGGSMVVKDAGEAWRLINSQQDLQFRTFITPVPEPNSLASCAFSTALVVWRRRLRRGNVYGG